MKTYLLAFLGVTLTSLAGELPTASQPGRWTEEKANAWYAATPWPVGANYVPRSAINQLEMWQADTFNPAQIDEEFGWAAGLGMNAMRVYLHDLLWEQDSAGLLERMDRFLGIADQHGLKIMFVFFRRGLGSAPLLRDTASAPAAHPQQRLGAIAGPDDSARSRAAGGAQALRSGRARPL